MNGGVYAYLCEAECKGKGKGILIKRGSGQCAAQPTVMQKWQRSPDTSVRGSRSFHAETNKSKPACLNWHGAREKSGILNINTSISLTPPQEQVALNNLTEKKNLGHRPFSKNSSFLWQYILKLACYLVNILTVKCDSEIGTTSSWDSLNMV